VMALTTSTAIGVSTSIGITFRVVAVRGYAIKALPTGSEAGSPCANQETSILGAPSQVYLISAAGQLHPVQQAFLDHDAFKYPPWLRCAARRVRRGHGIPR
jgi:hypothetical protein